MRSKTIINNQNNYLLITLSLFLLPLCFEKSSYLILSPIYFIMAEVQGYSPMKFFGVETQLYVISILVWCLIACYLPIQVTRILIAKHNINNSPIKLNFLRGMYCVLFSIIIQIGLFFPWMALMGIGRYLTFKCVEDHSILSMRILVGIFIAWACYKNIDNFKKLFTREFWDIKIIVRACLRFIVLSTLSGIITCGTFFAIYYISKQF